MSFFATDKPTPVDQKQSRLMQLAAAFLLIYSLALTLAPAARLHSWQVEYRWGHWIGFVVWLVGTAVVHHQLVRWLPDRDPFIFPTAALLTGWGLLTIWRLDTVNGTRQTIWLAICLLVYTLGLRAPDLLALMRRYKYVWLIGGLLLTGLTFVMGVYPGGVGPRLWLGCCGVYFQPSEPLKLLLIIYLAAYLADYLPVNFSLPRLLTPTLILIGAALVLLVSQRDLGTASLFILIYTVVVYIASQKKRTLLISLLVVLAAGITGYLLFDVVRIRVDAWINPWRDPAGRSYQIVQSIIAVASGGFIGTGPGMGSPGVVPVAHSDFIFSSIAEESGLLGASGLLLLYALLVGRGFHIALYATNNYRRYLAAGIAAYLGIQAIFITGGNLRLLPLTGVTLPFVSYGGSSLLTAFIALLILTLISNPSEEEPARLQNPFPYLLTSGTVMLGLAALALGAGWWAIGRNAMLVSRPENPRRVISDRFVSRGEILDRNNKQMARTAGKPGEYVRQYDYAPLSNTIGYNNALYGQSGLEAGLDGYLRGIQGNHTSLIFLDSLLYSQPPPGLDVRLSIDIELQKKADDLLGEHKGALVMMDASTGEILAIASHPYYDPNQLDLTWPTLLQDPNAPLINRATQGEYPPGPALGPFLMSFASTREQADRNPGMPALTLDGQTWNCAVQPKPPLTMGSMVSKGCPGPLAILGKQVGAEGLQNLFTSLGFYQAPDLSLQTSAPAPGGVNNVEMAAIGQENLTVTPLQMSLAAAALTNNGVRPAPQLAMAVLSPDQGWQALPTPQKQETLLAGRTVETLKALGAENEQYWQTVALARSNQQQNISWYVAGTLPQWQGTPLALAVVLEENNPGLAQQIGQALLDSTMR